MTAIPAKPRMDMGRFVSVRTKLVSLTLLAVLVTAAIAVVGLTQRERTGLIQAKERAALAVSRLFAVDLAAAVVFDDIAAVDDALARLQQDPEISAAAVWKTGSSAPLGHVPSDRVPDYPGIAPKIRLDPGYTTLTVVAPILGPGDQYIGIAMVEYSLDREMAAYRDSRWLIVLGATVLGGVIFMLVMVPAQCIVIRRLDRLEAAARALARGDRRSVDVVAQDEVGRLAQAFNTMSGAIASRETSLAEANRQLGDLFDNMQQAIFTIDHTLNIGPHFSRATQLIFAREDIAGQPALDRLLDGVDEAAPEAQALKLWFEVVFTLPPEAWTKALELAPRELTLRPGTAQTRELRVEFRPFFADAKLEQIMVLATDETDRRRIERSAEENRTQFEREMASMSKIVASGPHIFASFLRASERRWRRFEELLHGRSEFIDEDERNEMFRHAHTVKGEAHTFGLIGLEQTAARAEDLLSRLARSPDLPAADRYTTYKALELVLHEAKSSLETARRRLIETSALGEAVLNQVTVDRGDLDRVRDLATSAPMAVRDAIDRLAARPFAESTTGLSDAVPTWASGVGKKVRVEERGSATRIPARLSQRLHGCLTHLVRNAVAHGIEPPHEREQLGKPPQGVITLSARPHPAGVEIEVIDDGRGIDMDKLSNIAGSEKVRVDGDSGLLFVPGLSTAPETTFLAGHGMGLAAVRHELEGAGFLITLSRAEPCGTRVLITPIAACGTIHHGGWSNADDVEFATEVPRL